MLSYYFVFGMHEITLKIIYAYFNVSPIIECFLCVLIQVPIATKLFYVILECLLSNAILSHVVIFLLEICVVCNSFREYNTWSITVSSAVFLI